MTPHSAGTLSMLRVKLAGKLNRARQGEQPLGKALSLGGAALFFWMLIFAAIYRMLIYFRAAEGIGDLLAAKLLGIALLTFLMILLLSNVIAALSTFFLAKDLELLVAAPVDPIHLYWARLVETGVNSSWMVVLMVVPLFAAYGVMLWGGVGVLSARAVVLLALLVLPVVVGTGVTLLLVNVFPARRARDALTLVGLLAAAGVVLVLRLVRPERLIRPEEFRSVVDFMATLRTPTSVWLPSEWGATALVGWLNGVFDPFYLLLLLSTAAAFLVFGGWLHARYYHQGFSRAQEGAERREGRVRFRGWDRLLSGTDVTTRELVAKGIRVFFRDATQWSQLILLGVLVAVYVYNIRVLPASRRGYLVLSREPDRVPEPGPGGLRGGLDRGALHLPRMSLEGRMTWLLRSSPLDSRRLFWVKYWVGTVPLLLVALPLILITNLLLNVSTFLLVVST